MVDTVSRLIRQNTHTLRSRMVLFTTLTLIVSCSALSGYFVARQIDTATDALLKSGQQLASQLAATARYSVAVKDSRRIQELIRTTLTLDDVAYVFVASRDNNLLGALGTPELKRVAGPQIDAAWLTLFASRRDQALSTQSQIAPLALQVVNGQLVTESSLFSTAERLIATLIGHDRPRLFDITFPINTIDSLESDPTFELTFDNHASTDEQTPSPSTSTYGVIQIGLTDRHQQQLLRELLEQATLMTLAILISSLLIVIILARRITKPLHTLTTAAQQVASGDLTASAAVISSGEIGDLARVFNHMTRSLHSREQELLDMNRTLESKVASRTQDLQQANAQLRELDRLKTALVSNASHELRTPLTSIKVHVKNLLDGVSGVLASDQLDSLGRVQGNVERLRRLIDDLLDLSRLHAGTQPTRRESVGLSPLIKEVADALRHFIDSKTISLTFVSGPDLPELLADREQLHRAFTNLLHNAIKFTPPGGRIHIDAKADAEGTILVSIQDSGIGIPPAERDKIFLPFFRSSDSAAHIRGTGLGLSIAKELIQLHGGNIWVDEAVEVGSCFYVRLPRIARKDTDTVQEIQPLRA